MAGQCGTVFAMEGGLAVEPMSADQRLAQTGAVPRFSVQTVPASPTRRPTDDDAVAFGDVMDVGSNRSDDSRSLVTQYPGEGEREVPVPCEAVCVADTSSHDLDQDLARTRFVNLDVLDLKCSVKLADDGSDRLHDHAPQKGYCGGSARTVTHCISVNASMFATGPPKRDPVPEEPTPPNGTLASSLTVWSLICTMPVGMRSAND